MSMADAAWNEVGDPSTSSSWSLSPLCADSWPPRLPPRRRPPHRLPVDWVEEGVGCTTGTARSTTRPNPAPRLAVGLDDGDVVVHRYGRGWADGPLFDLPVPRRPRGLPAAAGGRAAAGAAQHPRPRPRPGRSVQPQLHGRSEPLPPGWAPVEMPSGLDNPGATRTARRRRNRDGWGGTSAAGPAAPAGAAGHAAAPAPARPPLPAPRPAAPPAWPTSRQAPAP
jgi:hypothetical protein